MSFAAIGFIVLVNNVFAQGIAEGDIQYPIIELGGCEDQMDCGFYCDKQENMQACINFAEENNLMSEGEIEIAKNFIAAGSNGPGSCDKRFLRGVL